MCKNLLAWWSWCPTCFINKTVLTVKSIRPGMPVQSPIPLWRQRRRHRDPICQSPTATTIPSTTLSTNLIAKKGSTQSQHRNSRKRSNGLQSVLWLAYDSKPQAKVGTLSNQRQLKQLKTWNHVEAKAGLTQVCILTLASQRWCSGILVFVLAKPGLAELNLALPHWAACNISSSCLDKAPSPPACFLKMSWRRNTRVELANHSWYDEPLFQWRKPLAPVYVPFALSRHCKCRLVKKIKRNPGQMLDYFAASLNSDPPACTLAGTNRSTSILKRDSWSWHSTGESLRSKL